ncbi:MAG: DNA-3-methyladenine glycosylase I [Atopobiaceae bacterium]|nr:DNA-3-methyladenine glycosylase I [Atopobiaceae bacterium]
MSYCDWDTTDELCLRYHDEEWGVPLHDDRGQFEFLSLEVMQCGLNWTMMLHRREVFRSCFAGFDFDAVAAFGIDERLVEHDLHAQLGVVQRAERRDGARHQVEQRAQVLLARKREPPRAQVLPDLSQRDVLLVRKADEVVRAALVVPQEEVLGTELAMGDARGHGLRDGVDRHVLV